MGASAQTGHAPNKRHRHPLVTGAALPPRAPTTPKAANPASAPAGSSAQPDFVEPCRQCRRLPASACPHLPHRVELLPRVARLAPEASPTRVGTLVRGTLMASSVPAALC